MKSYAAALVALIAGLSSAAKPANDPSPVASMDYQYLRYVATFNKEYKTLQEYKERRDRFSRTEVILKSLSHELLTSTVGHNKFSDWTHEEI